MTKEKILVGVVVFLVVMGVGLVAIDHYTHKSDDDYEPYDVQAELDRSWDEYLQKFGDPRDINPSGQISECSKYPDEMCDPPSEFP